MLASGAVYRRVDKDAQEHVLGGIMTEKHEPKFTTNWFGSKGLKNFERYLLPLAGRDDVQYLEIGTFEGRSLCWVLENVLGGVGSMAISIDPYLATRKRGREEIDRAKALALANVMPWVDSGKCRLKCEPSGAVLSWMLSLNWLIPMFDAVYIDGEHAGYAPLQDAVMAFPLLKVGGYLAFDDADRRPVWRNNVIGCADAFEKAYVGCVERLEASGQRWFRKIREIPDLIEDRVK